MPQREDGKNKALRIDLGYYRRRSWLGVFRGIAIVAGLIASLSYGVWVLSLERKSSIDTSGMRSTHLSTGPLALVHAHIENDCQSCHSEQFGVALSHDAWQRLPEGRLQLQAENCNACHKVDGHARAMLAKPEMDRDCARCHREHIGRDNRLTAVAAASCTECHRDLTAACKSGVVSTLLPAIRDFSIESHSVASQRTASSRADTPLSGPTDSESSHQFRSLLADRGRVRFDHAQHLQPGQVDPNTRGGFQLDMLPEELRAVYAQEGQQKDDLVQLNCKHCHVPSAVAESLHVNAIAREEGRFYAPINFDKHCAACHQISFAGQGPEHLPLPHVAQREEFSRLLQAKQTVELSDDRVAEGVAAIFARCQQCHLQEDTQPAVIARALAGTLEPLIPQRWLQHGIFDHAAHSRITRCEYCHRMPIEPGDARDQEIVLIRGPESCVGCHRPIDAPAPNEFLTQSNRLKLLGQTDQPTWASAECIECHRYHWSRPATPSNRKVSVPQ